MTVEDSSLGRAMAKLGVHDHACVIFETREQQIEAQTAYIATGLARGHRCAYAADANDVEDVRGFLRAAGVDVDAAEAQGAFAVMTARESYLRDGAFDPDLMIEFLHGAVDESEAAGFPVLRGSGEMSWNLAGAPGSERIFEYEAKLNRIVQERDCTLV
jgi:hypothetical protein